MGLKSLYSPKHGQVSCVQNVGVQTGVPLHVGILPLGTSGSLAEETPLFTTGRMSYTATILRDVELGYIEVDSEE